MSSKWFNKNEMHILQAENGTAILRPYPLAGMTTLIVRDKFGDPRDGYAQHSKTLEEEKRIAESRLKELN